MSALFYVKFVASPSSKQVPIPLIAEFSNSQKYGTVSFVNSKGVVWFNPTHSIIRSMFIEKTPEELFSDVILSYLKTYPDKVRPASKDAIQQVASQFLGAGNKAVALVKPRQSKKNLTGLTVETAQWLPDAPKGIILIVPENRMEVGIVETTGTHSALCGYGCLSSMFVFVEP